MKINKQDKQQIESAVEQYRREFAALDADELGDIWDKEYEKIIYIAQELAHPVRGWANLEKYDRGAVGLLKRVNTMILNDLSN